jgi:predicted site-specific integrase-resolvase
MTLSETMAFFHCSKATLYNWRKSGKIKSFKIGGKLYYKKETLLKNLKERKF